MINSALPKNFESWSEFLDGLYTLIYFERDRDVITWLTPTDSNTYTMSFIVEMAAKEKFNKEFAAKIKNV